jgi:hypothetical protein
MIVMKQPQEIEASYIIPLVRKGLVEELVKYNIPQNKIAELLGLTDAAVSQYLKSKRGMARIKLDEETKSIIKKSAKEIAENKTNSVNEIKKICESIKKRGVLCKVHKSLEKVPCSCEICECDKQ